MSEMVRLFWHRCLLRTLRRISVLEFLTQMKSSPPIFMRDLVRLNRRPERRRGRVRNSRDATGNLCGNRCQSHAHSALAGQVGDHATACSESGGSCETEVIGSDGFLAILEMNARVATRHFPFSTCRSTLPNGPPCVGVNGQNVSMDSEARGAVQCR